MQCSNCGADLPDESRFCSQCGTEVVKTEEGSADVAPPAPAAASETQSEAPSETQSQVRPSAQPMEAPTAQSVSQVAPVTPVAPVADPFLKKWNWGAFLLSWIWALGHGQVLVGILILVVGILPVIGTLVDIGLVIYLGIKGNELAWNSGRFASIEQLKETERVWTKWAVILLIIGLVLFVLSMIIGVIVLISSISSQSELPLLFRQGLLK